MTEQEARSLFAKKYPQKQIEKVVDYGEEAFVIEAYDSGNREDQMDPFFYVMKNNKEIGNYIPGDWIEFSDKMGFGEEDEEDDIDNYLEHHGIKGQKWGVRRFQNEDGSLTPAGKARYLSDEGADKALRELHEAYSRNLSRDEAYEITKNKKYAVKINKKLEKVLGSYTDQANKEVQALKDQYNNQEAVKKAKKLFASKKTVKAARELNVIFNKAAQMSHREAIGKSLEELYKHKLTKSEKDYYKDYVYKKLGYDW